MDVALLVFLGTLAGTLIGATSSIGTTILVAKSDAKRQRMGDEIQRTERARAFQRDSLLKTQEAWQDMVRLLGRIYGENIDEFNKSRTWGKQLLSDELDQEFGRVNRMLIILLERIADDALRTELKKLKARAISYSLEESPQMARQELSAIGEKSGRAMEHLGEVLRATY